MSKFTQNKKYIYTIYEECSSFSIPVCDTPHRAQAYALCRRINQKSSKYTYVVKKHEQVWT